MPWATRSSVQSASNSTSGIHTHVSDDSDKPPGSPASEISSAAINLLTSTTATTTARQNEALFEQLAASHAAQQDLEHRLRDQKRESGRRIAQLEKALDLCQKRERAIKAVFIREFEKEKELLLEGQRLQKKAERLNEKGKTLRRDTRELELKELQFEESVALHTQSQERNHTDDDGSDSGAEVHAFAQSEAEPRTPGLTNPFSYGSVKSLFNINPIFQGLGIDIESEGKYHVLLRKHDYYTGWLDAMKALDHRKVTGMQLTERKDQPSNPSLVPRRTTCTTKRTQQASRRGYKHRSNVCVVRTLPHAQSSATRHAPRQPHVKPRGPSTGCEKRHIRRVCIFGWRRLRCG